MKVQDKTARRQVKDKCAGHQLSNGKQEVIVLNIFKYTQKKFLGIIELCAKKELLGENDVSSISYNYL